MNYLKRTWAEVNLDRLEENIGNFKKHLMPGTKLMCVVKANCYGHGDIAVAPYLEELGVEWFAVSNVEEAGRLRRCGLKGEILILGYTPAEYAPKLCELNLIQTVVSENNAKALSENVPDGKTLRVHIAIDTGMTRIGIRGSATHTADAAERITKLKGLKAEGIFTHFACADSGDEDDISYTRNQAEKIKAVFDELKNRGISLNEVHFLNSAGGVYHSDSESTLARLGIILYGLKPNASLEVPFKLRPVMELKSVIADVKEIEPGVCISYGRTYTTKSKIKLATVCAGYADGYPRYLSNKGRVIINGSFAPVVGRVCMDQFMCDVTGIDVSPGDTAVLIGTQGGLTVTADEIAQTGSTIGYEVVCGISKRVPRVILKNGAEIDVIG